MFLSGKQKLCLAAIILFGCVIAAICVALLISGSDEEAIGTFSNTAIQISYKGAVVTNGHECAGIGRNILEKGGSAVDAAVAVLVCEGVAMPQSTGIGGGFLMTIYNRETGIVETLNAREVAPGAATEDMYKDNPEASTTGGLAVAVPGEVRGYEYAHKKYGKLPWKDLLQPTIDLCNRGHLVTPFLANLFGKYSDFFKREPSFKEIYIDPTTGEVYKEGQLVKRTKLAETLEIIAQEGADALYNGTLTQQFVEDIKHFGGIVTIEDMMKYTPQWLPPVKARLPYNQTLYSFPLPGSGIIMSFILSLLNGHMDLSNPNSLINWQRIVESFKFGYGKRTLLGDPDFVPGIEELVANLTSEAYISEIRNKISDTNTSQDPSFYGAETAQPEDHGTAHISILAPNGDAVSATGTINLIFGAKVRSQSTGIILNDEMDDFSSKYINYFGLPPSTANLIQPGKRPLSSMCPSIILNNDGSVRLVVGAAGGTKITTSTSLIALRNLWFGQNLQESINGSRIHHQLLPMEITAENSFPKDILNGLKSIGHKIKILNPTDGFSAATGVANYGDKVEGFYDVRRTGSVEYLT